MGRDQRPPPQSPTERASQLFHCANRLARQALSDIGSSLRVCHKAEIGAWTEAVGGRELLKQATQRCLDLGPSEPWAGGDGSRRCGRSALDVLNEPDNVVGVLRLVTADERTDLGD